MNPIIRAELAAQRLEELTRHTQRHGNRASHRTTWFRRSPRRGEAL